MKTEKIKQFANLKTKDLSRLGYGEALRFDCGNLMYFAGENETGYLQSPIQCREIHAGWRIDKHFRPLFKIGK